MCSEETFIMTIGFFRHTFGRALCVLLGVATAFGVGAALDARQAQAPPAAQSTPPPTTTQQTPPAGRSNAAAQGAVRDASGAIIGFTGLAEIPGTPWRIHDAARPHPRVITPGATPGSAPSDAIVLFDGKDLSTWVQSRNGQLSDAQWPVKEGYFETGAGTGSILTREKFGDVQLHVEFATPSPGRGASQDRGNSGVRFMGLYEVQVLDSFENVTYADGQAGSIYGEYPPLVNAARRPGEWQTYDIVFEAPKFNGTMVVAPAYVTVFWNGVLVQHRRPIMGSTSATTTVHQYTPHDPELPLTLQDHAHPVRYRNVWIRRLTGYDQPEGK
jgi:hypothetical protein